METNAFEWANNVGFQFVRQYYSTMNENYQALHRFYTDEEPFRSTCRYSTEGDAKAGEHTNVKVGQKVGYYYFHSLLMKALLFYTQRL